MGLKDNLRRIRIERGLDQTALSKLTDGVVTQQTISKIEKGLQSGTKSIHILANVLGVSVDDLMTGELAESEAIRGPRITGPDTVVIPEYDVEFAAGNGAIYTELEATQAATYRLSWLRQMRLDPKDLKRFVVRGDSMTPVLSDGDVILVDTNDIKISDGRVYAIRYFDTLRVKRLSRRIDGSLVLRSDNPEFEDEILPPDSIDDRITVIGRVRERCGTGNL